MRMYDKDDEIIEGMKKYLKSLKHLAEIDPISARKESTEALQRMGLIDENLKYKYPYNGERPKGNDFTYGPKIKIKGGK